MKDFVDFGIDLGGRQGGEVYTTCPECSPTRKKTKAKCLSVNTEKQVWLCHHCGWRGSLKSGVEAAGDPQSCRKQKYSRPNYQYPGQESARLEAWFAKRGITKDILARHKISLGRAYMPQLEEWVDVIQFPYFHNGECLNIKCRTLEGKAFVQWPGAEKILYGVDDLKDDWAVIVEGEMDKLALEVGGFSNVVSVPDGAPPLGSKPTDTKFEYLQNCALALDQLSKIILAVDADGPGKTLEAELARRLGPERCWRVHWPDGCKDANEVLLSHGLEILRGCIEQATPWPIDGLLEVPDLAEPVLDLYRNGWVGGVSTGWKSVDEFYTVRPGELTVVTGIPGHGKSEFLDAMLVNLALEQGWFIGVCSPENWPVEGHLAKLIEKYVGRPFGEGPTQRLSESEVMLALEWLQKHFVFFNPPEDQLTLDHVLGTAKQTVARYGIKGLVLDPWNEFDHSRPPTMTETEYISGCLTKLRRFARTYAVHVWVVAHPMKLHRREDGTYPIPTPYDISGSAHWRNKADNCLTLWRDILDPDHMVQVHVQKVRFRQVGQCGQAQLRWSPVNGRYLEK